MPTANSINANSQGMQCYDGAGTWLGRVMTAGAGISISNGDGIAGNPTIAAAGFVTWTEVTGTTQAMSVANGYVANNAALVTLTLPATAAIGDVIHVLGKGAGGWRVAQNANQQIRIGSANTTVGTGGSLSSINQYDTVELRCITSGASTIWTAKVTGNQTVV